MLHPYLKWALIALGALVGLFLIDRALLRMEEEGWIYYRRIRPASGADNALSELPVQIDLQRRVVVAEQQREEERGDDPTRELRDEEEA